MGRKKKLKIGDTVLASFLSTTSLYSVIEVLDKITYKLKCVRSGTILPTVKWKKDMDKKSVWFIDSYVGTTDVDKLTEDKITSEHTTDKTELDNAIEKQKKFTKGNINK